MSSVGIIETKRGKRRRPIFKDSNKPTICDVIADIVQLNDLEMGKVMPGQQLFVPSK